MATRGVPPTVKAKGVAIRYLPLRFAVVPLWIVWAPVEVDRGSVFGRWGETALAPLRCATLYCLRGGMCCSYILNEGLAPLTWETRHGGLVDV